MGLSPVRFVRHCSGLVSRASICLTMKARLAVAASGSAFSSSGVQWSVPIRLFVSQQPDCTGRSHIGGGRSSTLGLRGFGSTRMKGLMQSRQLSLIALPNPVPLVCLHLHRSMRIK